MVGKTSISKRFIKGKFIKEDIANRTINTNCYQKSIQIDDLLFNLNIWDTAGEEKYHAMAPIFYRGADGAVVIFDVTKRETFNRATKWFHELSEFAEGNPKIILVANKIDLPNKEVTNQEASALAQKYQCKFYEVSALLGTNVNEIFNSIALDIYREKKNKNEEKIKDNNFDNFNSSNNNYGNKRGKKLIIGSGTEKTHSKNRKGSCC